MMNECLVCIFAVYAKQIAADEQMQFLAIFLVSERRKIYQKRFSIWLKDPFLHLNHVEKLLFAYTNETRVELKNEYLFLT